MKIDGIDPLLLNRIKEQTDRMEVQRSEGVATDTRVSRESGHSRERIVRIPERNNHQRLEQVLKRLNEEAEKEDTPLRFSLRRDADFWHIEIRDKVSNEIVREIPTKQALSVLERIQSLFGVMLDEKR
jgi:uncharacterized FlaG/YvyC family protein